eukprot:1690385-Heterocapsa_arctica.AAC.1
MSQFRPSPPLSGPWIRILCEARSMAGYRRRSVLSFRHMWKCSQRPSPWWRQAAQQNARRACF